MQTWIVCILSSLIGVTTKHNCINIRPKLGTSSIIRNQGFYSLSFSKFRQATPIQSLAMVVGQKNGI